MTRRKIAEFDARIAEVVNDTISYITIKGVSFHRSAVQGNRLSERYGSCEIELPCYVYCFDDSDPLETVYRVTVEVEE